MLSLNRAIIYLQGVSGFRSRPAPGSETLVSTVKNIKYVEHLYFERTITI